jgi:hypothetical protein
MRRIVLAIFVLALSAATTANAQQRKKADAADDKKVKSFDFSGDQIDGDMIRPEGSIVDTRGFAKRTSLIRIRTDFVREILKTAEDL